MTKHYGERIRELRQQKGWTQAQLAEKLGKGVSTVRMWELGKNEPDRQTLINMSRLFDCSIDYIFINDIDESKNSPQEVRAIQRGMQSLSKNDREKALKILDLAFDGIFKKDEH
ncbi:MULTISPECIES: helix-turn-helix transcriptional regulator [Bacillus cereus group]|uniref:helix-turn-helix transcriptional regulator n=1 Tax=Bacillus cereus group TaxID=86661 RepID=UPI000BF82604|nr:MULTISPECIES: helix-turn-helix transcriptional regulator [Bacillus cereus group]PFD67686.1 hypothetical protein CN309_05315 [Bacillus thuringiensis]PGU78815.1 hypothetical protein COD76_23335 [Bacillus cereus]